MKKICHFAFYVLFPMFLLITMDVDARGGMGGGGGRGGGSRGGGRGGSVNRGFNRSPSMSSVNRSTGRSTVNRSAVSNQNLNRSVSRPSANRPTTAQRPASLQQSQKTATRSQVQQFLNQGQGIGDKGIRAENRLGQNGDQKVGNRIGGDQNNRKLPSDRADLGNKIRDQIGSDHSGRGDWFNGDFWDNHNVDLPYNEHIGNGYWWKLPTAAAVGNWLRWDDNYPVYYDYYPSNDYWGTADTSQQGAVSAPASTPVYTEESQQAGSQTSGEWMPLGVFALTKEGGAQATPNIYLQLALSKEGLISGTYYNTTLDAAFALEGVVDKSTKLAAWKIVDNDNAPILETGIYNLTQSQLPVKVNFADGRSQQFIMVRLNESQPG